MAISVATLDGGSARTDEAALGALRTNIRGSILGPGDATYADKPIFNAMHGRLPALIVRCADTADVMDAVKFAREHGLVAVRGGRPLNRWPLEL